MFEWVSPRATCEFDIGKLGLLFAVSTVGGIIDNCVEGIFIGLTTGIEVEFERLQNGNL